MTLRAVRIETGSFIPKFRTYVRKCHGAYCTFVVLSRETSCIGRWSKPRTIAFVLERTLRNLSKVSKRPAVCMWNHCNMTLVVLLLFVKHVKGNLQIEIFHQKLQHYNLNTRVQHHNRHVYTSMSSQTWILSQISVKE